MALNYASPYLANPYASSQAVSPAMVWVNGEAGARNYPVAPNTSMLLMDSESPKFYVKSADLLGVQTVRSYEYTEMTNATKPADIVTEPRVEYVSKEEFDALKKVVDDLLS